MVIRVPIGGYLRGGGPYHSQSGREHLRALPGSAVALPSNAIDAAGLLRTGDPLRRPGALSRAQAPVQADLQPRANIRARTYDPIRPREPAPRGRYVVVITWGALVQRSLLAAHQAEKDHISAAVLDLRTIVPYDWNASCRTSCARTASSSRTTDQVMCGFGARSARASPAELFEHLDAPVRRVGAKNVHVAYYPDLEEAILPQASDILKAIKETAPTDPHHASRDSSPLRS
jgi:2-oxoisovalerate dehydrogenase E1 component